MVSLSLSLSSLVCKHVPRFPRSVTMSSRVTFHLRRPIVMTTSTFLPSYLFIFSSSSSSSSSMRPNFKAGHKGLQRSESDVEMTFSLQKWRMNCTNTAAASNQPKSRPHRARLSIQLKVWCVNDEVLNMKSRFEKVDSSRRKRKGIIQGLSTLYNQKLNMSLHFFLCLFCLIGKCRIAVTASIRSLSTLNRRNPRLSLPLSLLSWDIPLFSPLLGSLPPLSRDSLLITQR